MNSRFFAQAESSEEEVNSGSEQEQIVQVTKYKKKKNDEALEDEGKRVVRTEKDKKFDELQ